jgi:hypothetical protein
LVETLASIASRYDDLLGGRFDAILDAWRARAAGANGRRVSWSTVSGLQTGVTAGVDDFGALLVRPDGCGPGGNVENVGNVDNVGNAARIDSVGSAGIVRIVSGEVIWL